MAPAIDVATTKNSAHKKPIDPATAMNTASSMNGSASTANSRYFAIFINVSTLGARSYPKTGAHPGRIVVMLS